MENEKNANYWENEIKYFEHSLEGLSKSFAILSSLKEHAEKQLENLLEETEAE